jgi:hypothetical protein
LSLFLGTAESARRRGPFAVRLGPIPGQASVVTTVRVVTELLAFSREDGCQVW